ncbi:MAG TPA: class I SAM-dependent methyltransferase [Gemmatimonadaceae bacterium]|jgi:methyltransferase (TIGR00027 family)
MPIESVSDTARWVAAYRAMETERARGIIRDPYAARLAGDRGRQMAAEMPRSSDAAWSMAVRTAVIDEIVLDLTRGGKVDAVMNLAAGLDARPWRLDLPKTLRWFDVDLPAILQHKTHELRTERPRVAYEAIEADLRDAAIRHAVFSTVARDAERVLVMSEGLLVYLEPNTVAELAADLHAHAAFRWWVFDLISSQVARMVEKSWGERLERANAPFRFAPAEGTGFFTPFGWRETQFRSMMEEGRRLGRDMPKGWFWRTVARVAPADKREAMRRMSGIALLARE